MKEILYIANSNWKSAGVANYDENIKNIKILSSTMKQNVEKGLIITLTPEIIVEDGERVFTSFIGKSPANLVVNKNAKVWEVIRCGARYHHNGICEDINAQNSAIFFCDFYDLPVRQNTWCKLYKRVKDDFSDYFSGTYKYYPGETVTALDWVSNERIVCGNALHLSATREQSLQWNEGGKLLKCEVNLRDMCVFPYNITQVRCREVQVLHSSHCHWLHFENEECDCDGFPDD
jgi:hypothetical protein